MSPYPAAQLYNNINGVKELFVALWFELSELVHIWCYGLFLSFLNCVQYSSNPVHFIKFALRNKNPSYPSNKSWDKMVIIYQWSLIASELLQKLVFWLVGFEKSNFNAGKWYFSCLKAFLFLIFLVFFTFCGFIKNMFTHKAP